MGRDHYSSCSLEFTKFVLLFVIESYFLPTSGTFLSIRKKNKTIHSIFLLCFKINDNKYYCQVVCISYLVLFAFEIACTTGACKILPPADHCYIILANNILEFKTMLNIDGIICYLAQLEGYV